MTEIFLSFFIGSICCVHGPYKGSDHDLSIFKDSGVLDVFPEDVCFFADRIYHEFSPQMERVYIAYRGPKTQEEREFNDAFGYERSIIENLFHRLKCNRNCFHLPWRHDPDKHQLMVAVMANMINVDIALHPLRWNENAGCCCKRN